MINLRKSTRGFTLIELLVVIAIIGILSSVVLASLNSARTKGSVAAVKAQMSSIAVQAEVFFDGAGDGDYDNVCDDPVIANALDQIADNDGTDTAPECTQTDATGAEVQNWAVSTTLKDQTTWCVDNAGWKKAGAAVDGLCQ